MSNNKPRPTPISTINALNVSSHIVPISIGPTPKFRKLRQVSIPNTPLTPQLRMTPLPSFSSSPQNRNTARSTSTNSITSSLPSSPASSSSQNEPISIMNRSFSSASVVPENVNDLNGRSSPPQLTGNRRKPNDGIPSIPPLYPSSREHSMEFDGVHYSCREVRRGGKRSTKKKIQKKKRVHFSKKGKKTRR